PVSAPLPPPQTYTLSLHDALPMSLGMSPNATTSSRATPSSSATRASVAALVMPAALISSSPGPVQVTTARSPTASSVASRNLKGSTPGAITSSLTTGSVQISASG